MAFKDPLQAIAESTAYHESGHAIACDELGVQFCGLSILPSDDGTSGRVSVDGDLYFSVQPTKDSDPLKIRRQFRAWAEQQAVIDYAGHAAVVVLLGLGEMSDKSAETHGAGADWEKARERLDGDAKRIEQAQARALSIVKARQEDVATVAKLLVERGKLSSAQTDWVLAKNGLPLPDWLDET